MNKIQLTKNIITQKNWIKLSNTFYYKLEQKQQNSELKIANVDSW